MGMAGDTIDTAIRGFAAPLPNGGQNHPKSVFQTFPEISLNLLRISANIYPMSPRISCFVDPPLFEPPGVHTKTECYLHDQPKCTLKTNNKIFEFVSASKITRFHAVRDFNFGPFFKITPLYSSANSTREIQFQFAF